MIPSANTIVNPRAMMVHSRHTSERKIIKRQNWEIRKFHIFEASWKNAVSGAYFGKRISEYIRVANVTVMHAFSLALFAYKNRV